jgi:hypothetical protein
MRGAMTQAKLDDVAKEHPWAEKRAQGIGGQVAVRQKPRPPFKAKVRVSVKQQKALARVNADG